MFTRLQHCTYLWQKLHRAVLSGGVVDGYVGSYQHTIHCESVSLSDEVLEGKLSSLLGELSMATKYPARSQDKDGIRAGWYRAVNGSKVYEVS